MSSTLSQEKSNRALEVFPLPKLEKHPNADTLSIIKITDTDYYYVGKTEEWETQEKFNLSSVFLIVFHLIFIIISVLIYLFAKENPQTGNYYF